MRLLGCSATTSEVVGYGAISRMGEGAFESSARVGLDCPFCPALGLVCLVWGFITVVHVCVRDHARWRAESLCGT